MRSLLVALSVLILGQLAAAQPKYQPSNMRGNANENADATKNVSPTPALNQSSADGEKNRNDAVNQDKAQSINLVSVPAKVPIEPIKDLIDYLVFVCTIILSGVGVVGTCAAIKTLKAIN